MELRFHRRTLFEFFAGRLRSLIIDAWEGLEKFYLLGSGSIYSSTTWLLIQRAIFVFREKEILVERQFVGDHRVVCPLLVVFTNRNGFFWDCQQQRNEERSLNSIGKCLDGRYENIFLEWLSPRGVFEFGGRSIYSGSRSLWILVKMNQRVDVFINRWNEVKDLRPNASCFGSSEYCQNTLVVYFC